MINTIHWLLSWLSLTLLKLGLRNRLKGGGVKWLQPLTTNATSVYNRVDFILQYCTGKKVLHIGFTDQPYTIEKMKEGSLLHLQLQKRAGALMGIDVDREAIQQYQAATRDAHVFCADIMAQYPPEAVLFAPEVILLSEVLEHLNDPYTAAEVLYDHFPDGTTILVTVPNYTSLDSIAASLHQTESIHPDHHWYFSPYTLRRLFDAKRFALQQLHFGMYYQPGSRINKVLKQYPFNGDCIIAVFTLLKKAEP